MAVFRIEIHPRHQRSASARDELILTELRAAGLPDLTSVRSARLFFLEGGLGREDVERIAATLLTDPVIETARILEESDPAHTPVEANVAEVLPRPGVMDPVAESVQAELLAEGYSIGAVRTGRQFVLFGAVTADAVRAAARRVLANDCIEELVIGSVGVQPAARPPMLPFEIRSISIRALDGNG